MRLLFKDIYINPGRNNVASLFNDRSLSAAFLHGGFIRIFGGSQKVRVVYDAELSGHRVSPNVGISVEATKGLDYTNFLWAHRFLTRSG